jgi:pSer/pThr/pTyr-binding forkhead associated (FHA) protein
MATLCLLGDDGLVVQQWEIGEKLVTIGRDATVDMVIPDDSLSRHHFTICLQGAQYVLKDLGSQNGTSVDGRRAQQVTLRHNDCIAAGRTLFLFHEHALTGAVDPLEKPPTQDSAFLPAALAAQRAAHPPGVGSMTQRPISSGHLHQV